MLNLNYLKSRVTYGVSFIPSQIKKSLCGTIAVAALLLSADLFSIISRSYGEESEMGGEKKCLAPGCPSRYGQGIYFRGLPKDPDLRRK